MSKQYMNLEVQFNKLFRHLKIGSFKTRELYGKAFKKFMVFVAKKYHLQKLSNISPKHVFAYLKYMQNKDLAASTIKTELAVIRFFHDNMPYTRYELPTNNRITFHGLRHTFAHEQYEKYIKQGFSDYAARKKVSELLGHHRDDVTRIYLAE